MSPGNHELKVKAGPIHGNWSNEKRIIINVPYLTYQKPWFRALALVGIFLLIVLIFQWRLASVKRYNQRLKGKIDEQTKIIEVEKKQLAVSLEMQKELTEELHTSSEAKNRLYAHISHEFKTPLQVIYSSLSSLTNLQDSSDLSVLQRNVQSLLTNSHELLDLSKAEKGHLELKLDIHNINALISSQIELKEPLRRPKEIDIVFLPSEGKVYLPYDSIMIHKVFSNLLSNVIKFSPNKSIIRIQSKKTTDRHVIRIVDQGIGIPAGEIGRLTEDFYQASNNQIGGTGIGLSLVHKILELHDSTLEIESAQGNGSVFGFSLPYASSSQNEIEARYVDEKKLQRRVEQYIDPSKKLLLLIEDDEDLRESIRSLFIGDYNLIDVPNALSAVYLLESLPQAIDIVLCDYQMPLMDGLEFLKYFRSKSENFKIPFVIFSGSTSEQMHISGIKSGANVILKKPVNMEILHSQIEELLNRRIKTEDIIRDEFVHELLPSNIHNDDLELMRTVESAILEHINHAGLKSSELAEKVGMGEKTLRNRVKRIAGDTLKEYMRNYRLEKAHFLILNGKGNLSEIATSTGFSSQSYFSRAYKAYFGISPSVEA